MLVMLGLWLSLSPTLMLMMLEPGRADAYDAGLVVVS